MKKIFYLFIIFVAQVCLGSDCWKRSESVLSEYAKTGWSEGYPICQKLLAQYEDARECCMSAKSFAGLEESDVKWDDFQTHCSCVSFEFTKQDALIDYLGKNCSHIAALVKVAEGLDDLGGEYALWAEKAYSFLNKRTRGLKEMCAKERWRTSGETGYPALFTESANMRRLTHHFLENRFSLEEELQSIQSWSEDVWYIGVEAIEFHRDKMRRSKCCQQQVQS